MSDLSPSQAIGLTTAIALRDGTTANLYYSFRSLALLEARFGSVAGIQDAVDTTASGAAFGPLLELIGAGLVGDGFTAQPRYRQDTTGKRTVEEIVYRRTADGRDLGDLLAFARIAQYTDAMSAAFNEAFHSDSDTGSQGNDGAAQTSPSPGPTSSTSAPSPSAAPTPSS